MSVVLGLDDMGCGVEGQDILHASSSVGLHMMAFWRLAVAAWSALAAYMCGDR